MDYLFGAVEGGGTKFVCAVASTPVTIVEQVEIPTTSPEETVAKVANFFSRQPRLSALAVASFGPIDLNVQNTRYGHILHTPKAGWKHFDIVGTLADAVQVPVAVNSDVNCAALGEQLYGAGQGTRLLAYVTVGTGIGVGLAKGGEILQGLSHNEMGHMLFPSTVSSGVSACPYHSHCLEGFASGTALQKRWGIPAEQLTDERAWQEEARYLGIGIANIILSLVPDRIIVGGSVATHTGLLQAVRQEVLALLNGYLSLPEIVQHIDDYIVEPGLLRLSGVTGALALARSLISEERGPVQPR